MTAPEAAETAVKWPVKNGVCLWCGEGVLEDGRHITGSREPCSLIVAAAAKADRRATVLANIGRFAASHSMNDDRAILLSALHRIAQESEAALAEVSPWPPTPPDPVVRVEPENAP